MSCARLRVAETGQQLLLAAAHRGCLVGLRVVVVEQMEHTVNHEQRDLFLGGNATLGSLAGGDAGAAIGPMELATVQNSASVKPSVVRK